MTIKDFKNCSLYYNDRYNTVEIRSKYHYLLMTIKLALEGSGTMTRIVENEDCDNFWIGVKPSDHVVFQSDGLFSKKQVLVKNFDWELK